MNQDHKPIADYLGIFVSALCVAECMVLPLVVALLPGMLPQDPESLAVHLGLAGALVVVCGFAFACGFRCHGVLAVALSGVVGVMVLVAGMLAQETLMLSDLEELLSTIGGIVTIGAHLVNLHLCQGDERRLRESAAF